MFRDQKMMVKVFAEKDKVNFEVDHGHLVHYSGYFRQGLGLQPLTPEDLELRICVPGDAEVFAWFIEWMYTQNLVDWKTLAPIEQQDPVDIEMEMEDEGPTYDHFAKLWMLANWLRAPSCQNAVVDTVIAMAARLNWIKLDIDYLYNHTNEGDPIRQLFVELLFVMARSARDLRKKMSAWPQEALVDYAITATVRGSAPNSVGSNTVAQALRSLEERKEDFYVTL